MASEFDDPDFVGGEFKAAKRTTPPEAFLAGSSAAPLNRPPTREELEDKVSDAGQKLAELKRAQEELERERAALEEARRRQVEFQTGRQEMIQNLTRGVGLLEQAEFAARRDAEQLAKTLADFRGAAGNVQAIREETWTQENYQVELTRALTTIENARMEWNSARLKWPVLSNAGANTGEAPIKEVASDSLLATRSFSELCKLGLALTWPLAVVALLAAIVLALLLRH